MRELTPDTVVDGRYRIVSRLGSGGMADVYCATDQQLGRAVALKLLHQRFAEDEEFVERFRREASSAAALSHPNVVNVYDRGEWDDTYYIAMEYLDGRSLKRLVAEEGALDPLRAIDIVSQILRAARFAHERGVIHRDLKPHNAIVDREGVVKVTDFGIARAGASDMTETGSIMGTAQYLSPEQAQGLPVGEASDLYSIGIVLHELLTGRVPFDGPSAVTIALKQVTEEPAPPSLANPAVTPELDAVVMRALAKDPATRFADAAEFLTALEAARQAQLAAVGAATAQFAAIAEEPAYLPEEPLYPLAIERERRAWPWVLAAVALAAAGIVALLALSGSTRTVPNVVGQPAGAAAATLTRDGYRVAERMQAAGSTPQGNVIATFPGAGAHAAKGQVVTLIVSSGPGLVAVPNVVSLGRAAAASLLRRAGFGVVEQLAASDQVARDHVISTDPAPLTEIRTGSIVTLMISTGRAHVGVPSVVGQPVDQATSELQTAGFQVARVDQPSTQTAGTVIKQDPVAGSSQSKGSTVTLTVAKQADQVSVPGVRGRRQADAESTLTGAGLTPVVNQVAVTDPAQDGRVISQSPKAGTKVKRGSSVTLAVGRLQTPTTTTPTTPTTPGATTPSASNPGAGQPAGAGG